MKSIFLFSSRLWFYLTEVPPVILLILAIKFNGKVDTLMKLYPLIITLSLLIVFIAVYFFKALVIKTDEVKVIGLFSGRDKAIINKGKTLAITLLKKGRLKIELFGNSENFETYAWLKDESNTEINLFRARTNGGKCAVKRILRFFGAEHDEIQNLISEDGVKVENKDVVFLSQTDNESKSIKIYFKETI